MSAIRYQIEYGHTALEDLGELPSKQRGQILRKIERLRLGLHGNIKRLRGSDIAYRLRMGDYRSLFESKKTPLSYEELATERVSMSRTLEKELAKTIREKREQLVAIRDEVEDLIDYLEVVEVRALDQKKPRLSHAEVLKRFNLK